MTVSLASQILCVKREIKMRERVYPNLVRKGQMGRGEAELAILHMTSVLQTLEWFERNEAFVREAVADRAERKEVA